MDAEPLMPDGARSGVHLRSGVSLRLMTEAEEQILRITLATLIEEHRDLDSAIMAMADRGSADQLQLTRLKKRKLQLRDQIAQIGDRLLPNIIA